MYNRKGNSRKTLQLKILILNKRKVKTEGHEKLRKKERKIKPTRVLQIFKVQEKMALKNMKL